MKLKRLFQRILTDPMELWFWLCVPASGLTFLVLNHFFGEAMYHFMFPCSAQCLIPTEWIVAGVGTFILAKIYHFIINKIRK